MFLQHSLARYGVIIVVSLGIVFVRSSSWSLEFIYLSIYQLLNLVPTLYQARCLDTLGATMNASSLALGVCKECPRRAEIEDHHEFYLRSQKASQRVTFEMCSTGRVMLVEVTGGRVSRRRKWSKVLGKY